MGYREKYNSSWNINQELSLIANDDAIFQNPERYTHNFPKVDELFY